MYLIHMCQTSKFQIKIFGEKFKPFSSKNSTIEIAQLFENCSGGAFLILHTYVGIHNLSIYQTVFRNYDKKNIISFS